MCLSKWNFGKEGHDLWKRTLVFAADEKIVTPGFRRPKSEATAKLCVAVLAGRTFFLLEEE